MAVLFGLARSRGKKGSTSCGGKNIHAKAQWHKANTNNGAGNSY